MAEWKTFEMGNYLNCPPISDGSNITVISRIQDHMELWWITPDGSVQDAFWYSTQQPNWKSFQLAPSGSAGISSGIAAISRKPEHMEIWWISPSGSIESSFWYNNINHWTRYQLAPPGSASTSSSITAISRKLDHMEVWWINQSGSVEAAFWYDRINHWTRYQLSPPGSANPSSGITVVSRRPDHMEIWWINQSGSVEAAFWYDRPNKWTRYQLALPGSASNTSDIKVISRKKEHMEIWWISPSGSIESSFWYDNINHWTRYQLAPSGSASIHSGLSVVSRKAATQEVWWIGPAGEVKDAYWYEGSPWKYFNLAPAGSARLNSRIGSVSRVEVSMEVWYALQNNTIEDKFWYIEEKQFEENILTPAGTALGGHVNLTLRSDGSWTSKFHMHDSGLAGYDFQVTAMKVLLTGVALVTSHGGHVGGTLTSGKSSNDFIEEGFNELIKFHWSEIPNDGKLLISKDYSPTGVAGFVLDIASSILDVGATAVGGAVGLIITLGAEVGPMFGNLGLGGTFGVIAGVAVYVIGGGVVMAVITGVAVGTITNAMIKQRLLSKQEIAFANDNVFGGTIPDGKIYITNLISANGRAFTLPGVDKNIYINMPSNAFDNPVGYGEVPGQLLIHELTHAWQSIYSSFLPGYICEGIVDGIQDKVSGNVYTYPAPGHTWASLNNEQQASIVEDWFAGTPTFAVPTRNRMDSNDPYFSYIRDNIRAGKD